MRPNHILMQPPAMGKSNSQVQLTKTDLDAASLDGELKDAMESLGPTLMKTKIEQHKVFSESARHGGPVTAGSGVRAVLDLVKISVRALAVEMKISRKKLQAMVDDEMTMPPDIGQRIWDAIERKRPGELDRLKNLQFD